MNEVKLNEFTKDEFWYVAKEINPEITWEEYEEMFEENMKLKEEFKKKKSLH